MTSSENTDDQALFYLAGISMLEAGIETQKQNVAKLKETFIERYARFEKGQGVLYGNHRFVVDRVEFSGGIRYNLRPWANRNSPHVYSPGDVTVMQGEVDLTFYFESDETANPSL